MTLPVSSNAGAAQADGAEPSAGPFRTPSAEAPAPWPPEGPIKTTGRLVLADGAVFRGVGFGAAGAAAGELCFNTAMTGYQEILTDPSYAEQIIAFTFPHIGNVGANDEDDEAAEPAARGLVVRELPTSPSSWRAHESLSAWLAQRGRIGIAGVDTRRLTRLIREKGMPHAVVAHDPEARFDEDALRAAARAFHSIDGRDLTQEIGAAQSYAWSETRWRWPHGVQTLQTPARRVVAIDFGAKRNILRLLSETGCEVIAAPPTADLDSVLAHAPDGVFLSNGPGDPAATARFAAPMIQGLLEKRVPVFGICLGHQLLALAIGAQTVKMSMGHHGANHPVKDLETGKVEIVSMNHGFAVDAQSLPPGARETHVSLFDGSNCGLRLADRPAFSVQHHPEASPGPQDSHYLFRRFTDLIDAHKAERA